MPALPKLERPNITMHFKRSIGNNSKGFARHTTKNPRHILGFEKLHCCVAVAAIEMYVLLYMPMMSAPRNKQQSNFELEETEYWRNICAQRKIKKLKYESI